MRTAPGDEATLLFHTYETRPGDTLGQIVQTFYGASNELDQLIAHNPQLADPNFVYPGNLVFLAVGSKSVGGLIKGGREDTRAQSIPH